MKSNQFSKILFDAFCQSEGLPMPQYEYIFHETRQWRIDIYFQHNGKRLALEVEGGTWGKPVRCNHCGQLVKTKNGKQVMQAGGRHTHSAGFQGDVEKYNALALAGIFLLRTTPKEVMKTATLNMVKKVLYGK